jgi:hypothetical protein
VLLNAREDLVADQVTHETLPQQEVPKQEGHNVLNPRKFHNLHKSGHIKDPLHLGNLYYHLNFNSVSLSVESDRLSNEIILSGFIAFTVLTHQSFSGHTF